MKKIKAPDATPLLALSTIIILAMLLAAAHSLRDTTPLATGVGGDGGSPEPEGEGVYRLPYKPLERRISVLVTGPVVEYEETWFYSGEDFEKILENPQYARRASSDEVLDRLCGCAVRVYTTGGFTLDLQDSSVTLSLTLHPNTALIEGRRVVDLYWLFQSLRLEASLLDFKPRGSMLEWRGSVGGVPTVIIIELPPVPGGYAPHGADNGFSDYRVWWRETPEEAGRHPPPRAAALG